MRVSSKTRVCGLIGDPVEHSLSPAVQNAAFEALGLNYVYVAFTVKQKDLGNAILGVRGLGFRGLNVTMPHKIEVIQYLDKLDDTAKEIGSVNTIVNEGGNLIGYTTDGIGALNALRYKEVDPSSKKIVVLGAGGSSRSVSFTLAEKAEELVILNRTFERAKKLVDDLSGLLGDSARTRAGRLSDGTLKKELEDADIVVNATSVGMNPKSTETPVDRDLLHHGIVVFDLVYEPLETRLLREARREGAETVDGLAMLVHQAAASFEIWTGEKAPIEVMMKAATDKLEKNG